MSEGPFGYSLLRQSFGEGAHSNRTWLLREGCGGGQQQQLSSCLASPAERGYLNHLVGSSGWSIPSTATQGEGHIRPYLNMCTADVQHTPIPAKPRKPSDARCGEITNKKKENCLMCHTASFPPFKSLYFFALQIKEHDKIVARHRTKTKCLLSMTST